MKKCTGSPRLRRNFVVGFHGTQETFIIRFVFVFTSTILPRPKSAMRLEQGSTGAGKGLNSNRTTDLPGNENERENKVSYP